MKFEWDPDKNKSNIKKHRVDFKEAVTVFEDEYAVEIPDEDHSQDEERWTIIGMSSKERELFVCHCFRNGDDMIRIFSARKATMSEKELYERRKR